MDQNTPGLKKPQNMRSPKTAANPERAPQPSKRVTPSPDLAASTVTGDKQDNAHNLGSNRAMAPNIVQENPRPCLWCTYYMVSFPSSERREFDEALGEGIICGRYKNENNVSHDGVLRCLRCRSGEPYRECLPIPDTVSESVLKSVEEMAKEHKAYVKERYDDESEKGQIRMARKLQLLVTPELHDCFTAIGAFSGLSKFPLETAKPLNSEEAAQIVSEIKAQVNPDSGDRDFSEDLDSSSVRILDSGVSDSNGGQSFSNPDISMATMTPPLPEDSFQAFLDVAPDQPPTLVLPTLAYLNNFNSFEIGDDMAPDSWTDMLGEFYCDSKLLATTNFAREDDIYASEEAELEFASTLPTGKALQTSSIFGHQDEQHAPIDASANSGFSEPLMSGALHPDDAIDKNDQAMDDCVYEKHEAPHEAPMTVANHNGYANSSFGQHHGSINPPGYHEFLTSDALPSINFTKNNHVSHNATTAVNDNAHPDDLLGEAIGGRLSNSFVEQLIDLVNLSRPVNGKKGPL